MKREYKISGRLIKRVENEYGDAYKPKDVKFYFYKAEKDDDIDFEIEIKGKRTPRLTAHNRTFETYSGAQAMLKVKGEYKYVNVNFENGEISPAFSGLVGSLCIDDEGKVFRLEDDGKTTYSEYTSTADKRTSSYLKQAVVSDASGKFGVIDENFHVIIPFTYDKNFSFRNLNFTNPEVEIAQFDDQTDFYFRGEKILSTPTKRSSDIVEKGKNLFYVYEGDNTRTFYQLENGRAKMVGTFKEDIVDACTVNGKVIVVGKDGVWELGKGNKKIFEGKITDLFRNEDEYFAVIENNGKKGLYSLSQNKVVVEPEYDEIDKEYSSAKTGKFLVSKRVDNATVWGVVDQQGNEVVPIEYTRPLVTTVDVRRVNGRPENALWVSKKDENGKNKEYLLCIHADDVITERKPVNYQAYSDKKDSSHENASPRGTLKSDEEKWGIALGASILFGSPIAGVIAMNMMNDEENSL